MDRWPTYRNLFQEDLEKEIEIVDSFGRIVQLVDIYRSTNAASRSQEFHDWLYKTTFFCQACGRVLRHQIDPEENSYILCVACSVKNH